MTSPPAGQQAPLPFKAYLFFGIAILIWGSSFILIKRGVEVYSPYQVGAIRLTVASLTLMPVWLMALTRKGKRYPWRMLFVVALTGNMLPAFLFPLAQQHIASATASAINALTPLFTLFVGGLFFGTKITSLKVMGILIGLLGCLVLLFARGTTGALDNLLYGSFAMIAAFCYGVNLNLVKRYMQGLTPVELTALAMLMAGPIAVAYLFSTNFVEVLTTAPNGWSALGYVALLGAFGTAFALLLFYQVVQLTTPVFAASSTYFIPFVAVLWGLADGEALTLWHLAGLALILFGVWLANRHLRRRAARVVDN